MRNEVKFKNKHFDFSFFYLLHFLVVLKSSKSVYGDEKEVKKRAEKLPRFDR